MPPRHHDSSHSQRGFTLVELSIVLVILGLLIGGVLTGQSLIRAAELRSISADYSRYTTAVNTFRDKYFALPGDLTNAASYWGAADGAGGNTVACYTTASTDSKTCNGNGDGMIAGAPYANEPVRAWQHLANAGLIEGSYPGVASPAALITPLNSPKGKISGSLWWIAWITPRVSDPSGLFDGVYGNSFEIGTQSPANDPGIGLLKPEEAYNIDTKLDDGKPAAGKVLTRNYTSTCTDAAGVSTAYNANYLLSNNSIQCALIFRQAY